MSYRKIILIIAALALLAGWGFIGYVNYYSFSPAVVVMDLGWFAVVLTGYYFFSTMKNLGLKDGGEIELANPREVELRREKAALVSAIKDVEFDYNLGKLSAEDAALLTRAYRRQAIIVLKAMECFHYGDEVEGEDGECNEDSTEEESVENRIERDIRVNKELFAATSRMRNTQ